MNRKAGGEPWMCRWSNLETLFRLLPSKIFSDDLYTDSLNKVQFSGHPFIWTEGWRSQLFFHEMHPILVLGLQRDTPSDGCPSAGSHVLSYDNKPEANTTDILISITFYHENDVIFLHLFLFFLTFSLSETTWIVNIEAIKFKS